MFEDYAVVFFGSSLFKIVRLFVVAAFSIHFFACLFYRVKVASFSLNVSLCTDQASQTKFKVSRFRTYPRNRIGWAE